VQRYVFFLRLANVLLRKWDVFLNLLKNVPKTYINTGYIQLRRKSAEFLAKTMATSLFFCNFAIAFEEVTQLPSQKLYITIIPNHRLSVKTAVEHISFCVGYHCPRRIVVSFLFHS
jgi:hypothetical protein